MNFSFREALDSLGRNAAFRIINEARPSSEYLLETLLPEMNKPDYHVDSGYMTIRATMAGLVGMDSPYPPGGQVEISTFLERTAKIGISTMLSEAALRQLQQILMQRGLTGANRTQYLANEAMNFFEKVVVQAQMDTAEWLRSKALFAGAINWTFNKKNLVVDYGVPSSFFGTNRSGNDRYNANHADNKFWTDHYAALAALRYNVRAIIGHTTTVLSIINTDANNFEVSQSGNVFTLRRWRGKANGSALSNDSRDSVQIIAYDREGEVIDPADTGLTQRIQFAPSGKLLYVGNNARSGYRVGEGSTPDPIFDVALGYTHIGPTVESGGAPGRWGRVFTPEMSPWQLNAEGAENSLPVREDVSATQAKTYVLSTDLS